jgi:ferredoxin
MDGDFGLVDKIDTSHSFLYGHRFWPQVKAVITKRTTSVEGVKDLIAEIQAVAQAASAESKATKELATAISAVGLMTLNQVGLDEFTKTPGSIKKPSGIMTKSPDAIVAARKRDDSQGLLGFLRTVDKRYTVAFTDKTDTGSFQIINEEEIATASARDRSKDWRSRDQRCWEGVVPVECRSASCGTCWVGVLGGEEKLSEVSPRERKQAKVFGYNQPEGPKPYLRLACQAKASGNVTIVIPPWNAVFGKKVYGNVEESELIPATTSARKSREIVKEASASQK